MGLGFVMVHVEGMGLIAGPPARGVRGDAAVSAMMAVKRVVVVETRMLLV